MSLVPIDSPRIATQRRILAEAAEECASGEVQSVIVILRRRDGLTVHNYTESYTEAVAMMIEAGMNLHGSSLVESSFEPAS